MGKGAGTCERVSLVAGELFSAASSQGQLKHETREEVLVQRLLKNPSYTERLIILERLRQIRTGSSQEIVLSDQHIDDEFTQSLLDRPAQARAIFLDQSVFEDDVVYTEYKRRRVQGTMSQTVLANPQHISPYPTDALPEGFTSEDEEAMNNPRGRAQMYEASSKPIHFTAELSEHAVREHCLRYAGGIAQHRPEQFEKLIAYCQAHASGQPVQDIPGWIEGDAGYGAFAQVRRGREEEMVQTLLQRGAIVEDNELEIPEYDSWANVEPGKRFALDLGDGRRVEYVPYHSVGTAIHSAHQHTVAYTVPPSTIDSLRSQLNERFEDKKFHPQEIVIIEREGHDPLLKPLSHIPEAHRDSVRSCAETGDAHTVSKGSQSWDEHVRFASDIELQQQFGSLYQQTEDGRYMWHARYREYTEAAKNIQRLAEDPKIRARWKTPEQTLAPDRAQEEIRRQLKQRSLPSWIAKDAAGDVVHTSSQTIIDREMVPHTAPSSQRGVLRVIGADPQEATDIVQKLHLAQGVASKVPFELAYGSASRYGRLTPKHEAYASGAEQISLPAGSMILHGMTGASHPQEVLARLERMKDTGGLKSLDERRRMNFAHLTTLSPKSDMVSGLDQGVAARIGNEPYTTEVIFGFKPSVIERRDVWFSPRDFGGGHSRYEEFNEYARSIGQRHMHDPPSHSTREQHLQYGTKKPGNEAFFRHEVRWEEIDTLFVREPLQKAVEQKINDWIKAGEIPPVRVESYSKAPDLQSKIQARAEQL